MFTENLCLKKIRSFKPSNPTHPLWFYYHEMYDNFSALNVTFWVMPSGKALPRWDKIVLLEHIRTRTMSSTFFGLRNWGHFAWPIRACFFLQIELAFKSRIIVEALTSECNIKLVPTLRTLKKKLPKKAGTTNWKCRLFRWPLQERRVV